jgi:hypothetical protein
MTVDDIFGGSYRVFPGASLSFLFGSVSYVKNGLLDHGLYLPSLLGPYLYFLVRPSFQCMHDRINQHTVVELTVSI